MKYLKKQYWNKFKPDGKKFEDLVALLLKQMYPNEKWIRTQQTWDGNKDFYSETNIWAECKHHQDNISLKIISPTLVMALLNNINQVLFFSYSKLNKNSNAYLSQFSEKTKKKISVFDDEILEALIFKYKNVLNGYFSDVILSKDIKIFKKDDLISADFLFNRDPDFDYSIEYEEAPLIQYNTVKLWETFCIDLVITNKNPLLEKKVIVSLEKLEIFPYFELLDTDFIKNKLKKEILLLGGEVFSYRFYFRTIEYDEIIKLPDIYLTVSNSTNIKINTKSIAVSWIMNTQVLGSTYLSVLQDFKECINNRNRPIIFTVSGESGTGKTRLLKEIHKELLSSGFKIQKGNGEISNLYSALEWYRAVISRFSGFPLNIEPKTKIKLTNYKDEKFIYKVLYDKSFNLNDNIEKCISLLFSELEEKRAAIVIDNLQFFDDSLIEFLYSFINKLKSAHTKLALILCFNTDYLFAGTKSLDLHKRLEQLYNNEKEQFYNYKIKGFTKGEAKLYVTQCIKEFLSYEKTIDVFLTKVGTIPLFIEQTLLYLEQKKVLKKEKDFFVISNIIEFHNLLDKLPDSIQQLVAARWELLQKENAQNDYEIILQLLVFFGEIPIIFFHYLNLDIQACHFLNSIGIIDYSKENYIRFHHRQLKIFFQNYFGIYLNNNLAYKCLEIFKTKNYKNQYPVQFFILHSITNQIDSKIIHFSIQAILNDQIEIDNKVTFSEELLKYTHLFENAVSSKDQIIKVYVKICENVKKHKSFDSALLLFKQIYNDELGKFEKYLSNGDEYFYFIFRFVNSYLSLHNDTEAQVLLVNARNIIDKFKFSSEKNRKTAIARILNRLCVTYKSLNLIKEAQEVVEESIKISKGINDKILEIKNYIDYGYIYYKDRSKNADLLKWWEKAGTIFFQSNPEEVKGERTMIFLHLSLCELIKHGKDGKSEYYITEGLKSAELELDHFYYIKLLLVQSLNLYFMNQSNKETLEKAFDYCVAHKSLRSYWTCFHLIGKTQLRNRSIPKEAELCFQNYFQALNQLEYFIPNSIYEKKIESRYEYFIIDLAIALRFLKKKLTNFQLNIIRNDYLKEKVKEITNMNNMEFSNFIENFEPSTSINDGKFNFPCP